MAERQGTTPPPSAVDPNRTGETHEEWVDFEAGEKTDKQDLDEATRQIVYQWSRAWLEKYYLNRTEIKNKEAMSYHDFIAHNLADLAGELGAREPVYNIEGKLIGGNRLTKRYWQAVRIFFEELIEFAEEKYYDEHEKARFKNFMANLHEDLFSFSPSLANEMGPTNLLFMAARANRNPEVAGWIGQTMAGESVYELSFNVSDESLKEILEKLESEKIEIVLDFIHQLRSTAFDAVGQGGWADSAEDKLEYLLTEIPKVNSSPLVAYEADLTLAYLQEARAFEYADFGPDGNFEEMAAHSQTRLISETRDQVKKDDQNLQGKIRLSGHAKAQSFLAPIASDGIAVLDSKLLPQFLGRVDLRTVGGIPADIPIKDLEILKEALSDEERQGQLDIGAILRFVSDKLLNEEQKANLAQAWREISSALNPDEWTTVVELLGAKQKAQKERAKNEARLQRIAENINLRVSNGFVEEIKELAPQLAEHGLPGLTVGVKRDLANLAEAEKRGNGERAFVAAENIAQTVRIVSQYKRKEIDQPEAGALMAQIMRAHREVTAKHQTVWRMHRRALHNYLNKFSVKYQGQMAQYYELEAKIRQALPEFEADLERLISTVESRTTGHVKEVSVMPYRRIADNSDLSPFAGGETEQNLGLLLQHLHQPELRALIEKDLGISLTDIPLRSQIHFLRFLAGEDRAGFDRLKGVLQKHPEMGTKILNSFLACAEDIGQGKFILEIAENYDPQTAAQIFDKYLEIAAATEHIRDFLHENFNPQKGEATKGAVKKKEISDEQINAVARRTLQRANAKLKFYAQEIHSPRDPEDTKAMVMRDLEMIKDEYWLITSWFAAAKERGETVEFTDVLDFRPEIITGQELGRNKEDVDHMLAIFEHNYSRYRQNHPEFVEAVVGSFKKALLSENSYFHVLRRRGKIVAFLRFDYRYDRQGNLESMYFGSVNIDPAWEKGYLGEAMVEGALKKEAGKGVPIEADCDPTTPISKKYVEAGFAAGRFYHLEGVPSLNIVLDTDKNQELRTKALSQRDIIAQAKELEEQGNIIIRTYHPGQEPQFGVMERGYLLTRYFQEKKPDGKRGDIWCVFEKPREGIGNLN